MFPNKIFGQIAGELCFYSVVCIGCQCVKCIRGILQFEPTDMFFEHPECYVMKVIILGSKFQIRVFCLKNLKKLILDFIRHLLLVT